jgi:hypothetical protein
MIYLFLAIVIYLAIGYAIATVTFYTKYALGSIPMVETKQDFLQCLVVWPLFVIAIVIKTIVTLLSKIPWPVYKDLD